MTAGACQRCVARDERVPHSPFCTFLMPALTSYSCSTSACIAVRGQRRPQWAYAEVRHGLLQVVPVHAGCGVYVQSQAIYARHSLSVAQGGSKTERECCCCDQARVDDSWETFCLPSLTDHQWEWGHCGGGRLAVAGDEPSKTKAQKNSCWTRTGQERRVFFINIDSSTI